VTKLDVHCNSIALLAKQTRVAASPAGGVWKSASLIWKSWTDGVVVYNTASGSTHLLNPVAAKVLRLLEDRPLELASITREVALSENVAIDEDLTEQVKKLLSSLAELGLVEPASSCALPN